MDSAALKALLEAQEKAYRSAMNIVVDQFKERILQLESKTDELVKSIEFTQSELDVQKKENKELKEQFRSLMKKQNEQEDFNRRHNLRVVGVTENTGETWEQTTQKITNVLAQKLDIEVSQRDVEAHRVGPQLANKTRPIVVRFTNIGQRNATLRNGKKLKGSGIYFNEDLSEASRQRVRDQLPLLKKARQEGKIAFFRGANLIIKARGENQRPTTMSASPDRLSDTANGRDNPMLSHDRMNNTATKSSGSSEQTNTRRTRSKR